MKRQLFKIVCVIAIYLVSYSPVAFGQIQIKFNHLRPTGEMGRLVGAKNALEIGLAGNFMQSSWRSTLSLMICNFEPRMDRFPIYMIQQDASGNNFQAGYEEYDKYRMLALFIGGDYQALYNKKYSAYMGAEIVVGSMHIDYTQQIGNVSSNSYQLRSAIAGIRARIGAEYYLTDALEAFVDITRTGFFITDPAGVLALNGYGIGLRYNF